MERIPVYNIEAKERGYYKLISTLRNLGITVNELDSSFILKVEKFKDDNDWNGSVEEFSPEGGLTKNYRYKVIEDGRTN